MERDPILTFLLLLLVGFLSYIVLQCAVVWIIRCTCPASRSTSPANRDVSEYRQGTVYSVSDDRPPNRYGDIFFIEPNSAEASRIREQLEKDEKELPSYDEVMRMCNLTTPTAAAAPAAPATPTPPAAIAALPAPPYSEIDPHSPSAVISMEPSTSRAAQTPTSPTAAITTVTPTTSTTEV